MQGYRFVVITIGILMLFLALIYSLTPVHHMNLMMHGGVDYTLYLLTITGVLLIVVPLAELALKSRPIETPLVEVGKAESQEDRLMLAEKLLNEDEARILRIVYENEGVTQDSIHFRTGFSHSKISMIMKKLEEKDLIVREKFGKTYRIYLSEWLGGKPKA